MHSLTEGVAEDGKLLPSEFLGHGQRVVHLMGEPKKKNTHTQGIKKEIGKISWLGQSTNDVQSIPASLTRALAHSISQSTTSCLPHTHRHVHSR